MTSLAVVIVAHNSGAALPLCLEALGALPDSETGQVTIVDSGSRQVPLSSHRVISLPNVGYGSACHVGAQEANGDWIAFLNPDVQVSWQQLADLLDVASRHGADAIGPTLTDAVGALRPRPVRGICPPWRRGRRVPLKTFPDAVEVEMIPGALLLVARSAYERAGGFDPGFFLYAEEDDLVTRLRNQGGLALVSTAVRVPHHDESSSEGVDPNWRRAQRLRGKTLYVRKHYSLAEAVMSAIVDGARLVRLHGLTVSSEVVRTALTDPRQASVR